MYRNLEAKRHAVGSALSTYNRNENKTPARQRKCSKTTTQTSVVEDAEMLVTVK
jgi:hypothetical protein